MGPGSSATPSAAGLALWRAVLDPAGGIPATFRDDPPFDQALFLNGLLTPALAAHFLQPVEAASGARLIDAEAAEQSRLINRFNGTVQRRWAGEIADSGIPVVFMKGFAFAHGLYPDPDVRTIGDIDLLVREDDLRGLLDFLTGRGFRFEALPTPAWGYISDASFMPLMSANGDCNIDLHIQPDCYPAYRSIAAEDVFAAAQDFRAGGVALKMPSAEHALLLCLTNAAKDKFGPFSARKLMDIVMLLRRTEPVDWDAMERLATEGRFLKPAGVAFALLRALGLPDGLVPGCLLWRPRGAAAGPFARLVADYAAFFDTVPSAVRVLERELTLCTEPGVAFHNAMLRLKGLIRRRDGLPAGHTAG